MPPPQPPLQNDQSASTLEPSPRPRSWLKRHPWLNGLLIIAFLTIGLGQLARTHQPKRPFGRGEDSSYQADYQQAAAACESLPQFTVDFTDPSLLSSVGPVGGINVGSASRSYITVKRIGGQFVTVPIYAPVDSTLTGIYHKQANYGELGARSEYRLEFDAGCGITYALDHIAEVTDAIKAAGPAEPSEESNKGNQVSIPLQAGEQLGRTDGTKVAGTWDFYVFNYAAELPHINSQRWESDHNKYAVCPYDLFTPDLKDQYFKLLALWDGQRSANLDCGTVAHDLAGSAAGGWFQDDATDMKGTHLYIWSTADMVEALIEIHEQSVERNNERFGLRTYDYAKQPEEMRPGDAACYSGDNKYIFARLVDEDTLQTAHGTGSCPTSFPTTDQQEWQR